MRKIGRRYYLIYSSELSHELCYATSDEPLGKFSFGGTIVSNVDIGYDGNTKPVAMPGNTHGSIEQINGEWYVFYHRQTHGTEFSRQGCAERIRVMSDGSIPQVEITSCGLNNGPLAGHGCYPASIACHLAGKAEMKKLQGGEPKNDEYPHITEENTSSTDDSYQYIANISDGTTIGYKYFLFEQLQKFTIVVCGKATGMFAIRQDSLSGPIIGTVNIVVDSTEWQRVSTRIEKLSGTHAVFLIFSGNGSVGIKEIEMN
jgi:hypothetical protein